MSSLCHQIPYDPHPEVVVNRAKFDTFTSSTFGRVKVHVGMSVRTDTRTDRIMLYGIVGVNV